MLDWVSDPEWNWEDLPKVVDLLWARDGEHWERWEQHYSPVPFVNPAAMMINYLAAGMGLPQEVEFQETTRCRHLHWQEQSSRSCLCLRCKEQSCLCFHHPQRQETEQQELPLTSPAGEEQQELPLPPPPPPGAEQQELTLPPPPAEGEYLLAPTKDACLAPPKDSCLASPKDACLASLKNASLASPKDASLASPKDASLASPGVAWGSASPGAAWCSASPGAER
ncbi:UNVERIFIED_CONTAM: hypothetical protein FKN15_048816 [Acipenser sinensis]